MKIAIGKNHTGFELKKYIAKKLAKNKHEVLDINALEYDGEDDYPDFARLLAKTLMTSKAERGILICNSKIKICITVNKHPGLHTKIYHDTYSATQSIEHNNMNVLCIDKKIVKPTLAREVVEAFLGATFAANGRHQQRYEKVLRIEERYLGSSSD